MPKDLFIPPDALEIILDSFSGPLDLLLYLIRRENMDIMDISMTLITQQYMQYIELIKANRMELAVDYLVMAAILAEIKSKLLLPVIQTDDEETVEDPRLELARRLLLYEQFKQAAEKIDALPRHERDLFQVQVEVSINEKTKLLPDVSLSQLVDAMAKGMLRVSQNISHQIEAEVLSVSERMEILLKRLQEETIISLRDLFFKSEARMGLIVSLLAALELAKQSRIILIQNALFSPIYMRSNV